jgi:hypothetical protein
MTETHDDINLDAKSVRHGKHWLKRKDTKSNKVT